MTSSRSGRKANKRGSGTVSTKPIRLRPEAIEATAKAVAGFAATARQCQALSIRVIATSAAREAVNASELVAVIQRASGLKVEVISGDQEADWALQGVTSDSQLAHAPLVLLDVGGGSTQFILGQGEYKRFRHSFPLGTVRLLEQLPHADPPQPAELAGCRRWLRGFLQAEVRPRLMSPTEDGSQRDGGGSLENVQLVGVGVRRPFWVAWRQGWKPSIARGSRRRA